MGNRGWSKSEFFVFFFQTFLKRKIEVDLNPEKSGSRVILGGLLNPEVSEFFLIFVLVGKIELDFLTKKYF